MHTMKRLNFNAHLINWFKKEVYRFSLGYTMIISGKLPFIWLPLWRCHQ
jgi:hypothetical protein